MDPITRLAFSICENKGVYALLLGSGVSRGAQIPTGWEITLDLIRRVAGADGVVDQADWAEWYAAKNNGKEPDYSELIDGLGATADERRSILHGYIEPTEEEVEEGIKTPTEAHRAIARLVQGGFIRVILTTNFDRLIENALREVSVEPTVISSEDHLAGAVPLTHSRCYVVKLHGDYLDARIKNTEIELDEYSTEINNLLDRILDEHGLIICGWSGEWDGALRKALLRAPNRRYSTFWAVYGMLGATARDLITHRGAFEIPITEANSFFKSLEQQVSVQEKLRRPHPDSTTLLVATAKRFLAKPEYRIELADLVRETLRQLTERLRGPEFTAKPDSNTQKRFEVATEPLVRLLGVMGRWGGGEDFQPAADALRELAREDGLPRYSALLALYGYGLGALSGARYEPLFRWLSLPLRANTYDSDDLAFDCLDQPLAPPGRPRLLYQYTKNILKLVSADYGIGGNESEYTDLFFKFEVMRILAYFTVKSSEQELRKDLSGLDANGSYMYLLYRPIPRLCVLYEHTEYRKVEKEISHTGVRNAVLKAGFCKEQSTFLDASLNWIQNFR